MSHFANDDYIEHLIDATDPDDLSDCCAAPIYTDYGVCSDCKEGVR